MKKSTHFKEIIEENMERALQSMGFADPSSADQRSKGLAFLRFFLSEVFLQIYDFDEEDLETAIVDKPSDLGIDFIYTSDDTVYIIQSKYSKHGKYAVDKEELEYFVNLPDNLKNDKYVEKAHSDLYNILMDLRRIKKPTF